MKSKLTTVQKNSIAKKYVAGSTGSELAAFYDVSVSTIFNILRDLSIEIRPRGRQPQAV